MNISIIVSWVIHCIVIDMNISTIGIKAF